MSVIPNHILTLRLDVALALTGDEATSTAALRAWCEAEDFETEDTELLLAMAVMQTLGDESLGAVALLAETFRQRLTEVRDGLQ